MPLEVVAVHRGGGSVGSGGIGGSGVGSAYLTGPVYTVTPWGRPTLAPLEATCSPVSRCRILPAGRCPASKECSIEVVLLWRYVNLSLGFNFFICFNTLNPILFIF